MAKLDNELVRELIFVVPSALGGQHDGITRIVISLPALEGREIFIKTKDFSPD